MIAAHSAGRSGLFDPDWTEDLIAMFARWPHLYADNSALCSPNQARTPKHIIPADIQQRIIHGSDYPVPVSGWGPWMSGHIEWSDIRGVRKSRKILQRDYLLKRAIGFAPEAFTRMDEIL